MTPGQIRILALLRRSPGRAFWADEIAEVLDIRTETAQGYLAALFRAGKVRRATTKRNDRRAYRWAYREDAAL